MNIFMLDEGLRTSASYMVDGHVAKQVLECFQLLGNCTTLHKKDGTEYALAHVNHPLAKWTIFSKANAALVYKVAVACATEHQHRTGKSLYYSYPFDEARAYVEEYLYSEPTVYPFCVHESIRSKILPGYELGYTPRLHDNLATVIKAYRAYYCVFKSRQIKTGFTWTNRPIPPWFLDYCERTGYIPF